LQAWKNWKAGTSSDIVDPILHQGFSKNEKMRCIHVGLLCVQEDIAVRPTMSSVLLMRNSTTFPLPEPSKPPFLMQPKRASSIPLYGQYSEWKWHMSRIIEMKRWYNMSRGNMNFEVVIGQVSLLFYYSILFNKHVPQESLRLWELPLVTVI